MSDERTALRLERLQEDESLRGELQDPAATALLDWASARLGELAADEHRADAAIAAAAQAIRHAARTAARAGLDDPQQVVAMAAATLQHAATPARRRFRSFRPRRPVPRFHAQPIARKDHS